MSVVVIGLGVFVLLFQVVLSVGLHLWGRRVASWRPTLGWRAAAFLPLLALAVLLLGTGVTVASLVGGFEDVATLRPEDKATALAALISESMNASFLSYAIAGTLFFTSFVALLVGTATRPRA